MFAKLHGAGGACTDAQLVLDAGAAHVVACTWVAIVVHQVFGNDEQAQALDSCRCIGQTRQDQMNDVGGHVMLAPGDEGFGSKKPVAAIRSRLCTGAYQGQVASGLGFGQVHGARPFAAYQPGEPLLLHFGGCGGEQGLDGAIGQHRTQGKAQVGAVSHLLACRADGMGQGLAAVFDRLMQTLPAALAIQAVGIPKTRTGADITVFPACRGGVTRVVERGGHLLMETCRLFKNGSGGVEGGIGKNRNVLHQCVELCKVLHIKQHVLDGRCVWHGRTFLVDDRDIQSRMQHPPWWTACADRHRISYWVQRALFGSRNFTAPGSARAGRWQRRLPESNPPRWQWVLQGPC